jgi:hypothetical protein
MDEIVGSVTAFVGLFVAVGGLITWYAVHVRRYEKAGTLPDGIVNRAA